MPKPEVVYKNLFRQAGTVIDTIKRFHGGELDPIEPQPVWKDYLSSV